MIAVKVYWFAKNPRWLGKQHWHIVATNNAKEAEAKALEQLKIDDPRDWDRYRPVSAFCEIL